MDSILNELSGKLPIKRPHKFVSNRIFQWQIPNSTTQGSDRGKNIIYNVDRNINLHLFVRKYKEIDRIVQLKKAYGFHPR